MHKLSAKKKIRLSDLHKTKSILREHCIHTVCEEARCPNIGDCFSKLRATFMIMGNACTRSCKFCNVASSKPLVLDKKEPERIAKAVESMKIKHVVVTSVTRDDLLDGGARHFADTVKAIRKNKTPSTIEVLTPDFKANEDLLDIVIDSKPDVFNHNIETVKQLSPFIRPEACYDGSLKVLSYLKSKNMLVKSGFMLGLGESKEHIYQTIRDLKSAGVDIITIGQYFRPNSTCVPVSKTYDVDFFEELVSYGKEQGFRYVFSSPHVRSSYMAEEVFTR